MSNSAFAYLVNKVLHDPEYAERLEENPREALIEIGIEPTDEILKALSGINKDTIVRLAEAFSKVRIPRAKFGI